MEVLVWVMIVTYVDSENDGDHDGSTDIGDNYQRGKAGTMVFVIVTYDDMIMLIAIGNNGDDHEEWYWWQLPAWQALDNGIGEQSAALNIG